MKDSNTNNTNWLLALSKADSKVDIHRWRKDIQTLLGDFASEEYQIKEWRENRNTTVNFPSELFTQWFMDFFDNPDWIVKEKILTRKEWNIILPFHIELKNFRVLYYKDKVDSAKGRSILEYKPWLKVRKKALETLKKLGWDKG